MVYPDTFEGFVVEDPKNFTKFVRKEFKPKPLEPYDIDVEIIACGVCGSDLHAATDGWNTGYSFPLCPGHEIVGIVVGKGDKVTTVELGDRVGVGAQIQSCLKCENCKNKNENYCPKSIDTYGPKFPDGTVATGGYSSHIRSHEYFTFKIPEGLDTDTAAPMLCAGLTTFSPLKRNNIGPGSKVAILGIGGLGHFALQWANALGAEVYALTRSQSKVEDAKKLGAHHVILTGEDKWFEPYAFKFDMILNTADAVEGFKLEDYLSTLKVHGKFWNVGIPDDPMPQLHTMTLTKNGALIGASHIGNREECLEMLQLAADKNLKAWVEKIPISEEGCGKALERLSKNDVHYRFTLIGYDKAFGTKASFNPKN